MHKKLYTGIIAVLLILAIIIYVHQNVQRQANIANIPVHQIPTREPSLPPNVPQSELSFVPEPVYPDPQGVVQLEANLRSYENKVTKMAFELGYDPAVLDFVSVKPVDVLFRKQVLVDKVDNGKGVISFTSIIRPENGEQPMQGHEPVLMLTFKLHDPSLRTGTTEVKYLPGTQLTAIGVNGSPVIKSQNATIYLKTPDNYKPFYFD